MTAREKTLVIFVGGTVALVINLFLINFFLHTRAQLQSDLTRKTVQLQAMKTLLANTSLWEQRDAWLKAKQPKLENEARAGSDLLSQVEETAKKFSVSVEQPQIANPDRHPQYTSVSVSVETMSTWKSIVGFLAAIQGPEKFMVLESANLRIDPKDSTQMHGRFRVSKWFAPKSG